MNEQSFNYADSAIKEMTDFFETRVENLEPKEEKKKYSTVLKNQEKSQEAQRGRLRLRCRRV